MSRLPGLNNKSFQRILIQQQQQPTTICFRARFVYIGKKMHPPILGGSLINVMVHPIPRHPALLLYGYYTCVEPRRLKRLTRCRIYPWRAENKTHKLSLPAEFKCAGREKHEAEIRWLEIEWQKHTIPIEKSSDIGRPSRV